MKVCTKCKMEKPLTREHFHKNKNTKDGFMGMCKACKREYYQNNQEHFVAKMANYRETNKEHCIEVRAKHREENKERMMEREKEYYKNNKKSHMDYNKGYYNNNKEEILKQRKIYREKNKEQIEVTRKVYLEKNKERIASRTKDYYDENKEYFSLYFKKYYDKNKERILEYNKTHYKNNPQMYRQSSQRRKAKILKLPYTLTVKEWDNIRIHFNYECAYCGKPEARHIEDFNECLHQDHFIALSVGGEYSHNNIIPACRSCNSSKSNKDFFEWYPSHRHYSKPREQFILKYLGYERQSNTQQLALFL